LRTRNELEILDELARAAVEGADALLSALLGNVVHVEDEEGVVDSHRELLVIHPE